MPCPVCLSHCLVAPPAVAAMVLAGVCAVLGSYSGSWVPTTSMLVVDDGELPIGLPISVGGGDGELPIGLSISVGGGRW